MRHIMGPLDCGEGGAGDPTREITANAEHANCPRCVENIAAARGPYGERPLEHLPYNPNPADVDPLLLVRASGRLLYGNGAWVGGVRDYPPTGRVEYAVVSWGHVPSTVRVVPLHGMHGSKVVVIEDRRPSALCLDMRRAEARSRTIRTCVIALGFDPGVSGGLFGRVDAFRWMLAGAAPGQVRYFEGLANGASEFVQGLADEAVTARVRHRLTDGTDWTDARALTIIADHVLSRSGES